MIKIRKEEEREGAFSSSRPLLSLRPMVHTHLLCVWPSLGDNLRWTIYEPFLQQLQSFHLQMLLVRTLRYAKANKNFTNSFTHVLSP